jgi:hypothetical protein
MQWPNEKLRHYETIWIRGFISFIYEKFEDNNEER